MASAWASNRAYHRPVPGHAGSRGRPPPQTHFHGADFRADSVVLAGQNIANIDRLFGQAVSRDPGGQGGIDPSGVEVGGTAKSGLDYARRPAGRRLRAVIGVEKPEVALPT